jgi:DNA gyrase inhibitor GyrI
MGVSCRESGYQIVVFGEVCDVVVGVKREGCKRRAEATYRMRGLLQWRHENGATEGCTEKKQ